jgi:hypothetical protein
MYSRWLYIGLLTISLFVTAAPQLHAQNAPQAEEKPLDVMVIPLQHMNAYDAVEVVSDTYAGEYWNLSADEQTNCVIIRSDSDTIRAVKELLTTLDVPRKQGEKVQTKMEYFQVKSYPLEKLALLAQQVVPAQGLRIAMDKFNGQLVVNGRAEDVDAVRNLVKSVDRPREAVTLTVYFLHGELGSEAPTSDPFVKRQLTSVAEELADHQIGDLSLLAPIVIRSNVGDYFSYETSPTQRDVGRGESRMPSQFQCELSGMLTGQASGDGVTLQLEAQLLDPTTSFMDRFQLENTVDVKFDEFLVITATPSGASEHRALITVVRVSKD